jgi:hypothetical protein
MKKLIMMMCLSALAAAGMAMATVDEKQKEDKETGGRKVDPKVCYKRCMEEVDNKSTCDYICYKKRD